MLKKVKATYRNGAFILNSPYDLPENTEVELMVNCPSECAQDVLDPETRKAILHELLTRMRQSSLMSHAHHATVSE